MNRKYTACDLWENSNCSKCSKKWYNQFDIYNKSKELYNSDKSMTKFMVSSNVSDGS